MKTTVIFADKKTAADIRAQFTALKAIRVNELDAAEHGEGAFELLAPVYESGRFLKNNPEEKFPRDENGKFTREVFFRFTNKPAPRFDYNTELIKFANDEITETFAEIKRS